MNSTVTGPLPPDRSARGQAPRGRPRSAKREGGFTLIEVVVAFVMLALVLAVSFEIFSTGMARAGDLEDRSRALALAQSRLALVGVEEPINEGDLAGESEDRHFQWTVSVRRYEEAADAAKAPASVSAYLLYRAEVQVAWSGADTRPHTLSLATLVLGSRTP